MKLFASLGKTREKNEKQRTKEPKRYQPSTPQGGIYIESCGGGKVPNYPYNLKKDTRPLGAIWSSRSLHHRTDSPSSHLCLTLTQTPRSRHVSSTSKLPDALRPPRSERLSNPVRPAYPVRPPGSPDQIGRCVVSSRQAFGLRFCG